MIDMRLLFLMYATWIPYPVITNMGAKKELLAYTARSGESGEWWTNTWMNSPAETQGSRPYRTIAGSYLTSGAIRNDGAFADMAARPE